MSFVSLNERELRRMADPRSGYGPGKLSNMLCESLASGEVPYAAVSPSKLYRALFGEEAFAALRTPGGNALPNAGMLAEGRISENTRVGTLTEANFGAASGQGFGSAVASAAFANVNGQIFYNALIEGYRTEDLIGDQLCETVKTTLPNEKIAGIGDIGDEFTVVDENDAYPEVGLNEQWIETPITRKKGGIISLTREAIFFDRTGQMLDKAKKMGLFLAITREKEIIDTATGIVNTYKRNGVAYNTYQSSTPYINQHQNVLVDYTDVENSELLLNNMLDPNTGEPMQVFADTILVPRALLYTARNIARATSVWKVDNQANAGTIRSESPNPLNDPLVGTGLYKILSSRYVNSRTGNNAHWFMGDFKRAFVWMENWPVTVTQAAANSTAEFERDIAMRFKVSMRGRAGVREPRFVVENTD